MSITTSQKKTLENSSNLVIGLATNRGVYLGEDLDKAIGFSLKRSSKNEEIDLQEEEGRKKHEKELSESQTAILCIINLNYKFVTGSYLGKIEIFS